MAILKVFHGLVKLPHILFFLFFFHSRVFLQGLQRRIEFARKILRDTVPTRSTDLIVQHEAYHFVHIFL